MESETQPPLKLSAGGKPKRTYNKRSNAGAAAVDVNSPEFAAAVAQATSLALEHLAKQRPAGTQESSGDRDFVKELAMNIAELNDQGTQRKKVAPEILNRRAEARKEMTKRIIEAHAKAHAAKELGKDAVALGLVPEYKVVGKTYINETFIEPFRVDPVSKAVLANEIYFDGVPNECMRPLNDVATGIFEEFVKSIGGSASYKSSKFAADNRDLSVTPSGLVVKGLGSSAKRTVGHLGDPIPDPWANTLSVKAAMDPSAKTVRVLGTLAEPAMQNFHPSK